MSGTVLKVGNDSYGKEFYFTEFDYFQHDVGLKFCHDEKVVWPHPDSIKGEVDKPEEPEINSLLRDDTPVISSSHAWYLTQSQDLVLSKPLDEYGQNPIFLDYFALFDSGNDVFKYGIYTDLPAYLIDSTGETIQYF